MLKYWAKKGGGTPGPSPPPKSAPANLPQASVSVFETKTSIYWHFAPFKLQLDSKLMGFSMIFGCYLIKPNSITVSQVVFDIYLMIKKNDLDMRLSFLLVMVSGDRCIP